MIMQYYVRMIYRDTIEITIYTPPVKDDLDLYKNDIAT